MVRAGESAGFLGPVLDQLADYTERSQEARQKIQMADLPDCTDGGVLRCGDGPYGVCGAQTDWAF